MKNILRFVFILLIEIVAGLILALLYWALSSMLFDKYGFGHSRINEAIYYFVILAPPFIYCQMESARFKRDNNSTYSKIYSSAGITYLVIGLMYMLIVTNFYLLGN